MATRGRLEYQITVPTGGWDTTVGAGTATITAGTYYLLTFLSEVATRFATASGTTCSVTISDGENGTGIVTITFGSATAITWVDTEVRDILGFEGASSSSATTHTGTLSARGIWLPNCPYFARNSLTASTWRGDRRSDFRTLSNMRGYVWAIAGQSHVVLDPLRWQHVKRERVWIANETTANQSIERFWRDTIAAEASWCTAGGPIRFYPDASEDAYYGVYRPTNWDMFAPDAVQEGWTGLYSVSPGPLIQVPGTENEGLGAAPTDGPNDWAVPETTAHFTSIGEDALDHVWLCQEASNDLQPSLGAHALTDNPTVLYQQTVTGWTRKAVGTTYDTVGYWTLAAGNIVPASESVAWVWMGTIEKPASGNRRWLSPAVGEVELYVGTTGLMSLRTNAGSLVTGVSDHADGSAHIIVLAWDRTAGTFKFFSDLETFSGTYDGTANITDQAFYLGSTTTGFAATTRTLWLGAAEGANAERDWRAFLVNMGVSVPY